MALRCRMADGRPAVLRASPDRTRLAFEAAALQAWPTVHAPAVLALDERPGAMLMEAIEPGTPLVVTSAYPALERIAELLGALHGSPPPRRSHPTVEEHVGYLFDASAKLYQRHPDVHAVVPPDLYERGRALAGRLARQDVPTVLLDGDLTPATPWTVEPRAAWSRSTRPLPGRSRLRRRRPDPLAGRRSGIAGRLTPPAVALPRRAPATLARSLTLEGGAVRR